MNGPGAERQFLARGVERILGLSEPSHGGGSIQNAAGHHITKEGSLTPSLVGR